MLTAGMLQINQIKFGRSEVHTNIQYDKGKFYSVQMTLKPV